MVTLWLNYKITSVGDGVDTHMYLCWNTYLALEMKPPTQTSGVKSSSVEIPHNTAQACEVPVDLVTMVIDPGSNSVHQAAFFGMT